MRFLSVVGEVLFIPILRKIGNNLNVTVGRSLCEGRIIHGCALVGVVGNGAENGKGNVIHKANVTDATAFGVTDGEYVDVEVNGERRTAFYDVQVRVHPDFRLEMHVDTDDANAAGIGNGFKVKMIKRS